MLAPSAKVTPATPPRQQAEDEAELPFLARRNPVVMAATVEAAISAGDVKKLRMQTGAGMMDCKKALTENAGDFEKATEVRRRCCAAVAHAWGGCMRGLHALCGSLPS